jgi:riboflavin synthase
MFTGLIEDIGEVKAARLEGGNLILEITASIILPNIKIGDSVNINGACQTVVEKGDNWFKVNTIAESLRKTNLGNLKNGEHVNLELALRPDSRLGGHMVSGHIDCVGNVKSIRQITGSWEIEIQFPAEFGELVVPKGSIAINGISLTVTHCGQADFGVSIIPHTWEMTTFPSLRQGDTVNLEFDLIGKYIQKMINPYKANKDTITSETLRRAGY